jgi:hypothetical protein
VIEVQLADGAVRYPDADRFTVTNDGELVLSGPAGEVARFGPGNWRNATDLDHPAFRDDD